MNDDILMKQDIQELLKLLDNGSNFFANKRALSYKRIIKTALQEQLNRLEGCEICNSNYKAISRYVGFYPKRAEIEIKDAVDGDVQIDIKCCPICGRKLRGGENEV